MKSSVVIKSETQPLNPKLSSKGEPKKETQDSEVSKPVIQAVQEKKVNRKRKASGGNTETVEVTAKKISTRLQNSTKTQKKAEKSPNQSKTVNYSPQRTLRSNSKSRSLSASRDNKKVENISNKTDTETQVSANPAKLGTKRESGNCTKASKKNKKSTNQTKTEVSEPQAAPPVTKVINGDLVKTYLNCS